MANQNVVEFTVANFEAEVLKSDKPVLVDFWAEWCPPCRALGPTIDKLADQYLGKVKIGKVDTDSNQDLAARYGIANIPTILLFKGGEVVHVFRGARKKEEFEELLNAQAV
jgi:thioredoxin 1